MHDTTALTRLYVVTRADLTPGLQAAQSVHAAFQFHAEHPDAVGTWLRDSNFLVVCAAPDEVALAVLLNMAAARGIPYTAVHEPDLGDQLTAVAFAPGDDARRLCASLPLALRDREPAMT